jgi:hypothetical protein
MESQAMWLAGHAVAAPTTRRGGGQRGELIAEHGYDTKYAMQGAEPSQRAEISSRPVDDDGQHPGQTVSTTGATFLPRSRRSVWSPRCT